MTNTYDDAFYNHQSSGSERSAERVLPIILRRVRVDSLIDVGCGIGTWTATAKKLGVGSVVGLDGDYVVPAGLRLTSTEFRPVDLARAIPDGLGKFDLALCLEVAEHLPRERADGFVAELCTLSDAVLFSAAAPNQGGTEHLNEQWPSAWSARFEQEGFTHFDIVRPLIWWDPEVEFYYRQNSILFVRRDSSTYGAVQEGLVGQPLKPIDAYHPEQVDRMIAKAANITPGIKSSADLLLGALKRSVRSKRVELFRR